MSNIRLLQKVAFMETEIDRLREAKRVRDRTGNKHARWSGSVPMVVFLGPGFRKAGLGAPLSTR